MASRFDSGTDSSLLEVNFSNEQYLMVSLPNFTFKSFAPDMRWNVPLELLFSKSLIRFLMSAL